MKWNLMPKAPSAFLNQFPEFSPLLGQLLYSRNLKTQKQIDEFFNPDYQTDIHDPYLLRGMKKSVGRIFKAIEKKERIIVYGDYDADGVCASAVLYRTLQELNAQPEVYIPDREKEGYGLHEKALADLAKKKIGLIITVDCGSTNLQEVEAANSLGFDVIITDHHQLKDKLPRALSLINPWQKGDKYPFKFLSGAGVAYKLACALLSKEKSSRKEALKKWLLDLVALATVADVMPLVGENRTLVKYGLGVLAQTKWLGLKKLMETAKLAPCLIGPSGAGEPPKTNLDCYSLAYVLAPRLNAAGRMDHADKSFYLLASEDEKEAEELVKKINRNNCDRQSATDKIIKEIRKRVESRAKREEIIFEGKDDWPVGLIGLAAGKIKDEYGVPTIVFCQNSGRVKASCRSVFGFNLVEILDHNSSLFETHGGHKKAAGFSAKTENISKIKEVFLAQAKKQLRGKELSPVLSIDAEIDLGDITWGNWEKIQGLAPFGESNTEPLFLARNLEVSEVRLVGNGDKHLKLDLLMFGKESEKVRVIKAIAFNMGNKMEEIKKGSLLDVVFKLTANEWNGYRELEMKVVDFNLKQAI